MNVKWQRNLVFIGSIVLLSLTTVVLSMSQNQDVLAFREESPILFDDDYVENFDTVFRRARWPPAVSEGGIFFPTEEQDENSRRHSRPSPSSTTTTTKPDLDTIISYPPQSQMETIKKEANPSSSSPPPKSGSSHVVIRPIKNEILKEDKLLDEQIDKFISWIKTRGLSENFVEAIPPPIISKHTNYFLTIGGTLACPKNHRDTGTGCEEIVQLDYDDES